MSREKDDTSEQAKDKDHDSAAPSGEEQVGDKRKRAVEPDGGPDAGVRGQTVPAIQSAKKAKTEAEAAS